MLGAFGPVLTAQPTLEGTVMDAMRHSGIAGVSVRLVSSNNDSQETTTDEAGRFSFSSLPASSYTVVLGKEGYVPADSSDEFGGRLPVIRPSATERVNFEMLQLSQLRGRVLHADGTPAAGVQLLLEQARFGQQMAVSGADGAYVFDVRPGSYYVLASPKAASPGKSRTTEAATYFPEASDFSQAQAIIVGAGSAVSGLDVHLRSISLYRLSGVVVNDSGARVKATVEVRKTIPSGSAVWPLTSRGGTPGAGQTILIYSPPDSTGTGDPYATATSDDGHFTFAVPEGEWSIHASAEIPGDRQLAADVAVVVPSEDQESLQIPLERTFDLKVEVEVEGGTESRWMVPPLVLRPADAGRPPVAGYDDSILNLIHADEGRPQKSMRFDHVQAGSYRVVQSAEAVLTGLYLAGFSVGEQNVMDRAFSVSANRTDLRAVFRRARGGLRGRTDEGKPATVLVIPESDSATDAILCVDSSKASPFSIPVLAPGNYTVVAVDKMDALRLSDASVRAALVTLGTRVTIDDTMLTLQMAVHAWPE